MMVAVLLHLPGSVLLRPTEQKVLENVMLRGQGMPGDVGQLRLRGGGLAEEQAAREQRMAASLGRLRGLSSELKRVVDECEDREDHDVMGYSSWGAPLSNNPTNAVVYNPDDYSDESSDSLERHRARYAPTAEGIASAMDKVDWIRNVVNDLAPEKVIAGDGTPTHVPAPNARTPAA